MGYPKTMATGGRAEAFSRHGRPYKRLQKISLGAARVEARIEGLLGTYHEMSDAQRRALYELMRRTKWRQSASSAATGRSAAYAFSMALKKATGRRALGELPPAAPGYDKHWADDVINAQIAKGWHGGWRDRKR